MKLDPNKLKTRDTLMVRLINGATKSGVQPDLKKQRSKEACRRARRPKRESPAAEE